MKHIGADESGKGDYFGYLVVAAVCVDEGMEEKLAAIGVRDSKKLLDSTILKRAAAIKKLCPYEIVSFSPEKYNLRYKNFASLNHMLAWAHAKALENLLKKVDKVDYILVDKFGKESLIENELKKKGIKTRLIQKTKAESDMAVAAASILARAEFLRTLRQLSLLIGFKLPKGATHVEEAGKEMVKRHGPEILEKIAKVHFKTTKKIKSA